MLFLNVCNSDILKVVVGPLKNLMLVFQILGPVLCICSILYTFIRLLRFLDDNKTFVRIRNSFKALIILFFIPLLVNIVISMVDSKYSFCYDEMPEYTYTNATYKEITSYERKLIIQESTSEYELGIKDEDKNTDNYIVKDMIAAGRSRCKDNYCDIAHRGYSTIYPDNSRISFEQAGKAGFWGVEADVRMSEDGILACNHDSDKDLDSKLSFSSFLDICKKYNMAAIVDIKLGYGGDEKIKKMVEMVKEKDMLDQTIFQCSLLSYLTVVKKYANDARVWYLRDNYDDSVISKAKSVGAEAVNINYNNVNENVIKTLHLSNVKVCAYVVPTVKIKNKFITYNIDYIMSDRPL